MSSRYELSAQMPRMMELRAAVQMAPVVAAVAPELRMPETARLSMELARLPEVTMPALQSLNTRLDLGMEAPQLQTLQTAMVTAPIVSAAVPELSVAQTAQFSAGLATMPRVSLSAVQELSTRLSVDLPQPALATVSTAMVLAPALATAMPTMDAPQLAQLSVAISRPDVAVARLPELASAANVSLSAPELQTVQVIAVTIPALQTALPALEAPRLATFGTELADADDRAGAQHAPEPAPAGGVAGAGDAGGDHRAGPGGRAARS
jgi:hypothetical protein